MNEFWEQELEPGYYDKLLKKSLVQKRGFQPNWHRFTMEYLSDYLTKDSEHLDFACGPGTLIGLYSRARSTGVDTSKSQIKYARENYRATFFELSEFNYKEYKNYFDTVTIIGLFEFLDYEEIMELMDQISYMLKQNGQMIVTTPNFSFVFRLLMKSSVILGKKNYLSIYKSQFKSNNLNSFFDEIDDFRVKRIDKILNMGLFFTIFSSNLGMKVEKFIYNLTNKRFGLLLAMHIIKKY